LPQRADGETIGQRRNSIDDGLRDTLFEAAAMATRKFLVALIGSLTVAGVLSGQPGAQSPLSQTRTDSAGDPLPPGPIARLGVTRFRHGGWNGGMTISPDSKTLVTTSETGNIRIWDIATGKLVHELRADDKRRFQSALYSPDGKWFVTTSSAADFRSKEPAELIFWDSATRKPERTYSPGFQLNRESPGRFVFTPDGKFLIGSDKGNVVVFEAESGKELLRYRLADGVLSALTLSPDGRLVAATEQYRGEVKLWHWESVEEPRLLKSGRDRGFGTLAFSPDGKRLFGRGRDTGDDGIAIWDVESGKLVKEWVGHRSLDYAETFAIHPDGKRVAVVQNGNRDGDDGPGIFLWDLESGKLQRRLPSAGRPILFSPDGRWLAARAGGGARVWDLHTGQEVAVHEASHRGGVLRMDLSSQGILATASEDNTIGLWDPAGKFLRKLVLDERPYELAFSGDGNLLLVVRSEYLDLWDVATGKKRYTLPGQGRSSRQAVRFSADGTEFCSFGDDYFFRRYRTANGKALLEKRLIPTGMDAKKILAGRDDPGSEMFFFNLAGAAFTRDSKTLVVAQPRRIHLFDTATGTETRHFDTEDMLDHSGFALSPDGRWLLAAAYEVSKIKGDGDSQPKRFVVIWDLETGKVLRRTPLPADYASRFAFSPDGKYFAFVGVNYVTHPRGQRVHIWETASGKEVHVIDNLPEAVQAVTFALDGRRLYTSMDDTTVLIWELPRTQR
jgi:WD40 repeat protein